MKKIIIVFGIILIIFIIIFLGIFNQKVEVKFDKCVDGDTFWLVINNKREKVRILGVDTPESTNYIEEYGIDASIYTCNLLKNANNIYLEYDINSDRYDKYDRLLAWVFVDNNNLSELLLSKGYANVDYIYGKYKYLDDLCNVQEQAYLNKVGIWNNSKYNYYNNYCYKKY